MILIRIEQTCRLENWQTGGRKPDRSAQLQQIKKKESRNKKKYEHKKSLLLVVAVVVSHLYITGINLLSLPWSETQTETQRAVKKEDRQGDRKGRW